jgi:hypothetical protein
LAQIFSSRANHVPLYLAAAVAVLGGVATAGVWYFFSPKFTDVGYQPKQPVDYSHELHAGQLAIDCRYCHAQVEVSAVASVPPTQVCMNCHQLVKRDSPLLSALRQSVATNQPVPWVRIHNVPDYAYFDHSVHVGAGVGCASCHGRIDQMAHVSQTEPLSMGWCLECHRHPDNFLRPRDQITNMAWKPAKDHVAFAAQVKEELRLEPPEDCSACHR